MFNKLREGSQFLTCPLKDKKEATVRAKKMGRTFGEYAKPR